MSLSQAILLGARNLFCRLLSASQSIYKKRSQLVGLLDWVMDLQHAVSATLGPNAAMLRPDPPDPRAMRSVH